MFAAKAILEKFESEVNQKAKPEVSMLLPVHNEAESIETVITDLYNEITSKIPVEIVVAEDGSTDRTKEILCDSAKKIPLKLILGDKRKGYSKGLIDGLSKVDTKYVVLVDSDGQHLEGIFGSFIP